MTFKNKVINFVLLAMIKACLYLLVKLFEITQIFHIGLENKNFFLFLNFLNQFNIIYIFQKYF